MSRAVVAVAAVAASLLSFAPLLATSARADDEAERGVHLVLAAELGGGALVPLAPAGALPMGHARPFLAVNVHRFTLQVEGTLELGFPLAGVTSSIAVLFALEATPTSRFEVGAGVGAGLLTTILVEDGGGGGGAGAFLIARKQWWFDRLGVGIGARLTGSGYKLSSGFDEGPPDTSYFLLPALSAHVALRL